MPSFQISLKPSKRAAGRFVHGVRRSLQKALSEEQKKRGLTQSAIAKAIGVHRSVINRELRGKKDITLGRVAELAWAMGRKAVIELPETKIAIGSNATSISNPATQIVSTDAESHANTTQQPRTFVARAA
jgi:transcriptional regulator with XRE-family HTH domain